MKRLFGSLFKSKESKESQPLQNTSQNPPVTFTILEPKSMVTPLPIFLFDLSFREFPSNLAGQIGGGVGSATPIPKGILFINIETGICALRSYNDSLTVDRLGMLAEDLSVPPSIERPVVAYYIQSRGDGARYQLQKNYGMRDDFTLIEKKYPNLLPLLAHLVKLVNDALTDSFGFKEKHFTPLNPSVFDTYSEDLQRLKQECSQQDITPQPPQPQADRSLPRFARG